MPDSIVPEPRSPSPVDAGPGHDRRRDQQLAVGEGALVAEGEAAGPPPERALDLLEAEDLAVALGT